MTLLRWTIRIHKWLALLVGLQIILWITGGLVMSWFPIEQVRGEHNIAEPPAFDFTSSPLLSPTEAAARAQMDNLQTASLKVWLDRPVYEISTQDGMQALIDATTGERLTPLDEAMAITVARADYAGSSDIAIVEYFEEPTWEYRRTGPAWRVSFDDGEGTRLYVSDLTGQVSARRNDVWRIFDFFWMLHIMDYKERENFNHPLLISASAFALITVLAGLILLIIRLRRFVMVQLAIRHQTRAD